MALGLVAACARQGAPPGGPPDLRPPVVVATVPDTYAVDSTFDGPVRFTFDERISERTTGGSLNDAVLVSPRTGEVRVDHGRQGLEVSVAGGFRPGRVYRVTLLPVVSDLFGNSTRDPFELVFSTGGELTESVIAGLAWDRLTGRGAPELQLLAVAPDDSAEYLARSDTAGIYAFRYLPTGSYRVVAFQDQNRNGEVDPMEVQGERRVQLGATDTVLADIGVLQPDTTPAVLTAVEVLDSVTLTLRFDDYIAPRASLGPANVSLRALAMADSATLAEPAEEGAPLPLSDTLEAPEVVRVFHEHEYRAFVDEERRAVAVADSLQEVALQRARAAGDSVAIDSLVTRPGRSVPVALTGGGASAAGPPARSVADGEAFRRGPDGLPLPSRRLVVILDSALVPNRGYRAAATGVVNLAGLPLGGGDAVVIRPPEPVEDSTRADSLATDSLAADSLGADSSAVGSPAADSLPPAPPRDSFPPADSLPSAPDTLRRSAARSAGAGASGR